MSAPSGPVPPSKRTAANTPGANCRRYDNDASRSTDGHTSPRGGSTEAGLLRMCHGYRHLAGLHRCPGLPSSWNRISHEGVVMGRFRQGSLSDKRRGLKRAALTAAPEPSRPAWSQFLGFYSLARNRNRRWTALSDRPLDLSLCAVTITAGTVGPVRHGEVCPADEQTRATWGGPAGWREVNAELTTDTLAPAGWGLPVNSHHGPTL